MALVPKKQPRKKATDRRQSGISRKPSRVADSSSSLSKQTKKQIAACVQKELSNLLPKITENLISTIKETLLINQNSTAKVYFKLRDLSQKEQFSKAIWANKIPCAYISQGVFQTTNQGKESIEQCGIALDVLQFKSIQELSPEERQKLKKERLVKLGLIPAMAE